MISIISLQFYINAALEVAAILFLVIILISSLMRRTRGYKKEVFGFFVLDLILLLSCNMVTWVLDGMCVSSDHFPKLYTLDLVLTVFDFFFYCLAGVMFLSYVCALIDDLKKREKKRKKEKRITLIHVLILHCAVMTGIFASSIYTSWFYCFLEDGHTYYTPAYWVLIVCSNLAVLIAFFVIIKNRKLLKKRKMIYLLSYLIIPILLLIADQNFELSISYLSLSFIALLIYVEVDTEQDQELLKQEAQLSKIEAEKTEMKINIMVSQIQPHFLYNTLGTIYQLCGKDINLARETIKNFTKYLRTNIDSLESNSLIKFEKELEHTKTYLSIELLRFSDVLKVEYDINCTDFMLPALSLQPIVENAVKHGIRSRENGGTVTISTRCTEGKIFISVHDDGMGFVPECLPDEGHVHIGISNVRNRLEYMCKGKLIIKSEIGIGTTVTIILEEKKDESTAY